MAIPDLLRGCPLFFELYDSEIEKIASRCSVLSFKKNDLIVKDGSEGNEIFIMLEGESWVTKRVGEEKIKIQSLLQGDVFGEMVLVDEKIRSADVEVHSEIAHVLEMAYSQIFGIFKSEPKIFGLLQLNLSRLIAKRLRASNEQIMRLQEKS